MISHFLGHDYCRFYFNFDSTSLKIPPVPLDRKSCHTNFCTLWLHIYLGRPMAAVSEEEEQTIEVSGKVLCNALWALSVFQSEL